MSKEKVTNFEYFKDEILEATKNGSGFGIRQDNGRIVSCSDTQCCDCRFSGWMCTSERVKWGFEEHIEKPKLTKKERMFCELVETGWIARDENGLLYRYSEAPYKKSTSWNGRGGSSVCVDGRFRDCIFSFITWDDKEPWSVEELLKLEVMD